MFDYVKKGGAKKKKVVDKVVLKQMTRWLQLFQSLSNLSIT